MKCGNDHLWHSKNLRRDRILLPPVVLKNCRSISYRMVHRAPKTAPPILPSPIVRRLSARMPSRQDRQSSGGMPRVHCASAYTVRSSPWDPDHGASPTANLSGRPAAASASALRSSVTSPSNRAATARGTMPRFVTSTHSGALLKAERKSRSEKRSWHSSE